MNSELHALLDAFKLTITKPSFVYVGIGSCPHARTLEEYTENWNQILPVFVKDVLRSKLTPVHVLHFDPAFGYHKERVEFVDAYFKNTRLGLVRIPETNTWSNGRLSVTLSDKAFNHTDKFLSAENSDDWFLENLATHCISVDAKLVVQEYTGKDLDLVLKAAFIKSPFQKKFKENVLFDITYGTASSCQTDMATYKPLYDARGNFYNLLLYTPAELKEYIGFDPMIDTYIKIYFTKQYNMILNNYHVDYRRRTRGETTLFKNDLYTDSSEPELIMDLLQAELCALLPVFRQLGVVSRDKNTQLHSLFETYKSYTGNNLYRWYDLAKAVIS
jgi:Fe-S cluster assembly iron-binding protein IscA